jgi:hypothetical protein
MDVESLKHGATWLILFFFLYTYFKKPYLGLARFANPLNMKVILNNKSKTLLYVCKAKADLDFHAFFYFHVSLS